MDSRFFYDYPDLPTHILSPEDVQALVDVQELVDVDVSNLVTDNHEMRALLARELGEHGYEVIQCADGPTALDYTFCLYAPRHRDSKILGCVALVLFLAPTHT